MVDSQSLKIKRLWVLLAAVGVCLVSARILMPYIPDDSYISFRYAENLVKGHGLTFNPGEPPVEAYSNLLWILGCAFLYQAGFDLPSAIPLMGTLIATLNILLLWLILQRRNRDPLQMFFPLVLLAASGPFIMYAVSGLETALFALLLLVMMFLLDHLLETGRTLYSVLLAVAGVLLALCRPEGLLAFPFIVVVVLLITRKQKDSTFTRTRKKTLLVGSAVFVGIMVVYHIWRIGYFGEVLPTPFLSKAGGGKTIFNAWFKNLYDYYVKHGDYYPPVGFYFAALTGAGVIGLMCSKSNRWQKQTEIIAMAMCVAYGFVYFNFVDWMPGMRYYAPLVGMLLIPAGQLQTPLFESGRRHSTTWKRMFWIGGITVTLMSYSVLGELRLVTERTEEGNQKCLVTLGKWLRQNMPGGSVLAMSDVGAVPYYSGFTTVDIHPESLTDLHIAKHGFSNQYFYEQQPNVVVIPSRSIFLTKFYPDHYGLTSDSAFQQLYRFVGVVRYQWHYDRCYWVYVALNTPPFSNAQMDAFPPGVGTIARKSRSQ